MSLANTWIAFSLAALSLLGLLGLPQPVLAQVVPPTQHQSRDGDPSAPASSPPTALRAALARYNKEPSITEVLRAAQNANRSSTNEELRHRARLSGLVPVIGLKARRGQAVDLASSAEDEGLRLSTDDDLTLEAAMTFHLARTVFASEEVSLAREARAERLDASKRAAEIIRLYFERRRLQLERDLLSVVQTPVQTPAQPPVQAPLQAKPVEAGAQPPTQTGQSAPQSAPHAQSREAADLARIMRIAEIEAQLDVFTGGAFRRMMRR